MHKGDAVRAGLPCVEEADRLAVQLHAALVVGNDAADDLHQRGFPSAVFAQKRMHLAFIQVEADVVQDLYGGAMHGLAGRHVENILADMFQLQDLLHAGLPYFMRFFRPSATSAARITTPRIA